MLTPVLLIEADPWTPAEPEAPALQRVAYDDLCHKEPPPVTSVYALIVLCPDVNEADLRALPRSALDWLYKSTVYSTLVLHEDGTTRPLRTVMGLDANPRPDPTAPVF